MLFLVYLLLVVSASESEGQCVVSEVRARCGTFGDVQHAGSAAWEHLLVRNRTYSLDMNIDHHTFESTTSLQTLLLEAHVRKIEAGAFLDLHQLSTLVLNETRLSSVSGQTFRNAALKELKIEKNNVHIKLEHFCELTTPRLEVLVIRNSGLAHLPKRSFRNLPLRVLDLSGNEIVTIQNEAFCNLTALEELYLSHNRLSYFGAGSLLGPSPLLKRLELQHNNFHGLSQTTFEGLPSLAYLDLSHNQISLVMGETFAKLPYLAQLYLDSNNLSNFYLYDFPLGGHTSLKIFSIRNNQLTCFSLHILQQMPVLSEFCFDNNRLKDQCLQELQQWMTLKDITCPPIRKTEQKDEQRKR